MKSKLIIQTKNRYILIESQRKEYWELLETLDRLLGINKNLERNVIWIFNGERLELTIDDVHKLANHLKNHVPIDHKVKKKVALVFKFNSPINSAFGLHAAIAEMYIETVKDLPLEFKIFANLASARDWILK